MPRRNLPDLIEIEFWKRLETTVVNDNGLVSEHRETFGCLLYDKRMRRKLSLAELAQALNSEPEVQAAFPKGLIKQSINTWESGRSYPPRTIDAALCRVLKIRPSELVIEV